MKKDAKETAITKIVNRATRGGAFSQESGYNYTEHRNRVELDARSDWDNLSVQDFRAKYEHLLY